MLLSCSHDRGAGLYLQQYPQGILRILPISRKCSIQQATRRKGFLVDNVASSGIYGFAMGGKQKMKKFCTGMRSMQIGRRGITRIKHRNMHRTSPRRHGLAARDDGEASCPPLTASPPRLPLPFSLLESVERWD